MLAICLLKIDPPTAFPFIGGKIEVASKRSVYEESELIYLQSFLAGYKVPTVYGALILMFLWGGYMTLCQASVTPHFAGHFPVTYCKRLGVGWGSQFVVMLALIMQPELTST